MAYSNDFRQKVIEALQKGASQREVARRFSICLSTVNEWWQKYEQTGTLEKKPLNRTFKKIDPEKLRAYVTEHPDAYQDEMAEEFGCNQSSISKSLARIKITRKKNESIPGTEPRKGKAI